MQKNAYELSVHVKGKPTREYFHNDKIYIEGRENSEFEIVLRNNSPKPIEAVFSVDGLDVLDGKTASTTKIGYIVNGWATVKIDGWRLNNDEVAKFQFAGTEGSYAAQKGVPRNVGVIGVAIFSQKEVAKNPYSWGGNYPNYMKDNTVYPKNFEIYWTNNTAPGQSILRGRSSRGGSSGGFTLTNTSFGTKCSTTNSDASINISSNGDVKTSGEVKLTTQGLGTAFGRKAESKVTTVSFDRANTSPDEVFEIRYNDKAGLERLGIKVSQPLDKDLAERETAKAFEDIGGGCQPPKDWQG